MQPTSEDAVDERLVERVAGGDRTALEELYGRHAPWVMARLARRCPDPGVVEEVVQDTFVAIWRGARRYRGEGPVPAWIWGIGVRRLVDRMRRGGFVLPFASRAAAEPPSSSSPSAEDMVLDRIEHGSLGAALDSLSPELRAVLRATVLDGLSTREAGRLLGIPQGTVKTRAMRARQLLREALT